MPDPSNDFIITARKRFDQAADDERKLRAEALTDLKFLSGDQWDPKIKQDREGAGRPAEVFNRLPTFVAQVSNEARQNKPQIKFAPTHSDSYDEAEAEVYEGLARYIQYASNASVAYETAMEYSVGGGFGYWRYLTKEVSDTSFDQELVVVPVLDPFNIYGILVPAIYGRKARFGFVTEDMPIEEYKAQYSKTQAVSMGLDSASKMATGWVGTETIRLAEYWYMDDLTKEIALLEDGRVVDAAKVGKGQNVVKTRKIQDSTIKFCKINGIEVLPDTETIWPGKATIPIVPVLGKQLIVDGKPMLQSLIRFMRGPQRLINYGKNRISETLATAPISPFIGVAGQFAGQEQKWNTANSTLRPYLEYNDVSTTGKPVGPPQRQVFEAPIQALSEFVAQEVEDTKAISGIFDASLGDQGNEKSGIAIKARQQQSNSANLAFMDNLERAFRIGGDITAEIIPVIYDTAREIKILGPDEAPKVVAINKPFKDANGVEKHYKIEAAKYDIVVTIGRSFSTKRMESFDMISQIIQANPELFNIVGDIWLRNSDSAGAEEMAERMKKLLPPQLQQEDGDPAQQAQQAQAKLAQQGQVLEQANQVIQQQHQIIQTKQVENQGKLQAEQLKAETSLTIEKMKIEAQVLVAEITTKAQESLVRLKLENDMYKQLHGDAHEAQLQANDHAHQQDLAESQQSAAADQQANDQSFQAAQAEQQPEQ